METPNGVRSTVGGRFIPSGLLLAQDFTHEPACQTGERAPQGRFRHQPEQMVHPPFAWQLASFPSLPVCGEEAPYCPLRDFATLRTYPPKIKAQQALFAFLSVYPELVALIGSRVPDYRGLFLRGVGGNSAALGILQEDEIKSHSHKIPRRMILPGEGLKHDSSLEEAGLEPYAVSGESSYTGGNETRPKNRAVRYLIRVR